ncbi:fumarylacetoacetate hydrolase family protein [Kamptonema cortianum]|nr:fumarylacetoacetate hydrolase family protein [Kamptonema cortianum]
MKLCRFELVDAPGEQRSGIFHEGNIYETDGQMAAGIHDLSRVQFLSPVGRPLAIRVFESFSPIPGEWDLTYFFMNPTLIRGTNESISIPPSIEKLDFEIRLAAILQDGALMVDASEADKMILGYTFLLVFIDKTVGYEDTQGVVSSTWTPSHDVGAFIAPFVVTPEELNERMIRESRTNFQWSYKIYVNDELLPGPSEYAFDPSMSDLMVIGSQRSALTSGEIITWPPLPLDDISTTPLGRYLIPGDEVRVVIDGLGAINGKIG